MLKGAAARALWLSMPSTHRARVVWVVWVVWAAWVALVVAVWASVAVE